MASSLFATSVEATIACAEAELAEPNSQSQHQRWRIGSECRTPLKRSVLNGFCSLFGSLLPIFGWLEPLLECQSSPVASPQ